MGPRHPSRRDPRPTAGSAAEARPADELGSPEVREAVAALMAMADTLDELELDGVAPAFMSRPAA
jgi:hypothetical protein